jgi:hypothetical protein
MKEADGQRDTRVFLASEEDKHPNMGDSEGHPVSSEERGVSPDEDGEW